MGCPTTYDGKTATWSKGRLSRLSSGTLASGTKSYTYSYNGFGQRVSKGYSFLEGTNGLNPVPTGQVINYSKKYYYDHAGRLVAETVTKTLQGEGTVTERIVFLYDESSIIGMEHTTGGVSTRYYFQRNLMGDVLAIVNTSGTVVARYLYDAFGNCTIASSTTNYAVANANPIRYRGYYYDDDTGLYYCNARYYSPKWRRFISPDDTAYLDPETVNGLNLYCYCNNDPVNYADPSGHFVISAAVATALVLAAKSMAIGFAIGAVVGAGFEIYAQICSTGWDFAAWDLAAIGMAALGGGVSGLITAIPVPSFTKLGVWGTFLSYGATFALGAAGTLACGAIAGTIDFENSSEVITGILVGGFANVVARGISDLILSRQTSKIMNMPRKAKSLTIQEIQGELGVPSAMKGVMRNAYKNYTRSQVSKLLVEANPWIKYGIYSGINSAWMSSLPYAF